MSIYAITEAESRRLVAAQIADVKRLRELHALSACNLLLMGENDQAASFARQVEAHNRVIDNLHARWRAL